MERVDNLTCEGCLHIQIKMLTKQDSRHCTYCLRKHGESRIWQSGKKDLLAYLMDCYINLAENSLPTLTMPPEEKINQERPKKREKPRL